MVSAHYLLGSLWKRRWSFLATVVLVLLAVGGTIYVLPKVYETTSYLLVTSRQQSGSDFEATQTNQVLMKTYAELLQTRNVADAVAAELPFPASGRSLQRSVEIKPITQSQLIAITAAGSSPERAKIVADSYARVFAERMRTRAVIGAGSARVSLAEAGALVTTPARPRPVLYTLIGGLLAVVAGAAVALLRQRLDQRLEVEAGATELLGLPVIGRIPRSGVALDEMLSERSRPALMPLAEASRLLFANLAFANLGRRPASLAVVSPGQGEGKSTCALMVARAATELGLKVALIDGDLRRPNLSAALGPRPRAVPEEGFSTLLIAPESFSLEGQVLWAEHPSFRFVPAGPLPPNPAALLGTDNLAAFVRRATSAFDVVVFDTPPLLIAADASLIAAATEGVILVLDPSQTQRTAAVQALDQLKRAHGQILGVVLSRIHEERDAYSYYATRERDLPETRGNGRTGLAAPRSRRRRSRR